MIFSKRELTTLSAQQFKRILIFVLCFLFFLPKLTFAKSQEPYTKMSLENLMDIKVTTLAKKSTKTSETPSAVYTLTQEDIKRSGATRIVDVLRLAPGVQVAQIDSNKWAVSIRGFNNRFSNKLLVLVDGRTVFRPLFSGALWESIDYLLDDIERIEIIRGPGGTLWGANAVNGIINIITKNAKDTQKGIVTIGGGKEQQGFFGVRYGVPIQDHTNARVYLKGNMTDNTGAPSNSPFNVPGSNSPNDNWKSLQSGFRSDTVMSPQDNLLISGDVYTMKADEQLNAFEIDGLTNSTRSLWLGNILSSWEHEYNNGSSSQFQIYYDHFNVDQLDFKFVSNTFDIDFQHTLPLFWNQELTWGSGYRLYHNRLTASESGQLIPPSDTDHLFDAFVQDDIFIIPNRLRLILGSKFFYNKKYTGFEYQPSARLAFLLNSKHTLWASFSRAVRIPSRTDEDAQFFILVGNQGGTDIFANVSGNKNLKAETVYAYEAGYRGQYGENVFVDIAGFINFYNDIRTREDGALTLVNLPTPHFEIPSTLENNAQGRTYGFEASVTWQVLDWWRLTGNYSLLLMDLNLEPGSTHSLSMLEDTSPTNQANLISHMNLPYKLQFDFALRFVDDLPAFDDPSLLTVDPYFAMDVRLAWQPTIDLELEVIARNLFNNNTAQFDETISNLDTAWSLVQTSVYGRLTYKF